MSIAQLILIALAAAVAAVTVKSIVAARAAKTRDVRPADVEVKPRDIGDDG
jgi:hypothetical protein